MVTTSSPKELLELHKESKQHVDFLQLDITLIKHFISKQSICFGNGKPITIRFFIQDLISKYVDEVIYEYLRHSHNRSKELEDALHKYKKLKLFRTKHSL